VAPETAGDPMSEQTWVRSSLRTLSERLFERGHRVSPPTVGRVLKSLKFSLRVNAKQVEARSKHSDRAAQFETITAQRTAFTQAGLPIISVDGKKKELIGNFKQAGRAWSQRAERVNVHDFLADSQGRAVPYGIYDLTHNQGFMAVGSSGDTAAFAVDAITAWWDGPGSQAFPLADQLLILADGGGSNSWQGRLWKLQVQEQLCDRRGLTVTICHYPTGCSKWNPIEHRLFGPISSNWAAKPLRTFDTLLAAMRGTTSRTGLSVQAQRLDGSYPTGRRVSTAQMNRLNLTRHDPCPTWTYTLRPRHPVAATPPNQELIA
jgi:hypothetical protein